MSHHNIIQNHCSLISAAHKINLLMATFAERCFSEISFLYTIIPSQMCNKLHSCLTYSKKMRKIQRPILSRASMVMFYNVGFSALHSKFSIKLSYTQDIFLTSAIAISKTMMTIMFILLFLSFCHFYLFFFYSDSVKYQHIDTYLLQPYFCKFHAGCQCQNETLVQKYNSQR